MFSILVASLQAADEGEKETCVFTDRFTDMW